MFVLWRKLLAAPRRSFVLSTRHVDSRTLLQVAIAAGGLRVAGLLLDNGADPFAVDKWGKTALHCAVATGDPCAVVRRFVISTFKHLNALLGFS